MHSLIQPKHAALLFANFINEATNFAENCGGGGTLRLPDGDGTRMKMTWNGRVDVPGWLMI